MPAMQYNDFYITVCDTIKCTWGETSWSYLASPRPTHGFLIVLKGQVDYFIDGKPVSLFEREVIYLPKGSKYNVRMHIEDGAVTTLLINFDMIGFENFLVSPFQVLHDSSGMLSDLFNKIYDYSCRHNKQKLLVKSYTYLLYHHILSLQNDMDADHRLIRDAKLLLSANEVLSIDEIAERLLVSSSSLRKKFKALEGMSLAEYRVKARIGEAKSLLISTDLSISEIAEQCGFYDNAYFYKMFCREVGKTPKEYRKSADGNI